MMDMCVLDAALLAGTRGGGTLLVRTSMSGSCWDLRRGQRIALLHGRLIAKGHGQIRCGCN